MKRFNLRALIFMALCCDLGLISKKLISPAANVITEALHIPGGVATSFSVMFLVIAASVIPLFGCATIMGAVQSVLALAFGMTGSMGILAPFGYILPGLVIDCLFFLSRKMPEAGIKNFIMIASIAGSVTAALAANMIVFRLWGLVLIVYLLVSATCGVISGMLAILLNERLSPVINYNKIKNEKGTFTDHYE